MIIIAFAALFVVQYHNTMEKLKLRNIIMELKLEIDVLEGKLRNSRDQNIRIKTDADK